MRERLEQHRRNPACASCHAPMDPLGFALENFDAIGGWRTDEAGQPMDASGVLPDGSDVEGPAGLRQLLLSARTIRHHRHRKTVDLRARPGGGTYYAPRCARSSRRCRRRTIAGRPSYWVSSLARLFRCGGRRHDIITRRRFPVAPCCAAGAILALPFLDAMVPASAAPTAAAKPPRRLGVVYVPNGIAMPLDAGDDSRCRKFRVDAEPEGIGAGSRTGARDDRSLQRRLGTARREHQSLGAAGARS